MANPHPGMHRSQTDRNLRQPHETWSSWPTFVLAATGSAVGLGNIWKFPYMMGESGGGAFVLVYLICIALLGIPILMTEIIIGRRGRLSPIGSFELLAGDEGKSRRWRWVGILATVTAFLILSFYSVIGGWAMPFVGWSIAGFDAGNPDQVRGLFDGLLASPWQLLLWHTVFMGLTVFVSARGIKGGIEKAVTIMVPGLFIVLLVLIGFNILSRPDAFAQAFRFMFTVDFSKLNGEVVLAALGHAFFSLSLASGSMIAYGSYLKKRTSITGTALVVGTLDTLTALLAGLAIFPIVFAFSLEPSAGPGLVFVTLPLAFGEMPGGQIVGPLFFTLLVIAAWSSGLSLLESVVEWLTEVGMTRRAATYSAGVTAWAVGLATVLSLNVWSDVHPLGFIGRFSDMTIFDLLDYSTANIAMPIVALLTAIFAGWVLQRSTTEDEFNVKNRHSVWYPLIRYVAPAGILAIFVFNLL